eukprot:7148105-Prymnesium_polylepis.1
MEQLGEDVQADCFYPDAPAKSFLAKVDTSGFAWHATRTSGARRLENRVQVRRAITDTASAVRTVAHGHARPWRIIRSRQRWRGAPKKSETAKETRGECYPIVRREGT